MPNSRPVAATPLDPWAQVSRCVLQGLHEYGPCHTADPRRAHSVSEHVTATQRQRLAAQGHTADPTPQHPIACVGLCAAWPAAQPPIASARFRSSFERDLSFEDVS